VPDPRVDTEVEAGEPLIVVFAADCHSQGRYGGRRESENKGENKRFCDWRGSSSGHAGKTRNPGIDLREGEKQKIEKMKG